MACEHARQRIGLQQGAPGVDQPPVVRPALRGHAVQQRADVVAQSGEGCARAVQGRQTARHVIRRHQVGQAGRRQIVGSHDYIGNH